MQCSLTTALTPRLARWLDITPLSRIVARCTADTQAIDITISQILHYVLGGSVFMISRVLAVCIVLPSFVVPACLVALVGGMISNVYMRAQLCVKREMSNARAPLLGHFSSAISGLGEYLFLRNEETSHLAIFCAQYRFAHMAPKRPSRRHHTPGWTGTTAQGLFTTHSIGAPTPLNRSVPLIESRHRWVGHQ